MYYYLPVEETCRSEEIGTYVCYGVCALKRCGLCWREIDRVSDAALERETAAAWARLFTEQQLEPVHLPEMILDLVDRPAVE